MNLKTESGKIGKVKLTQTISPCKNELTPEDLNKAIEAMQAERIREDWQVWNLCTNNTLDHHIDFTYQGV